MTDIRDLSELSEGGSNEVMPSSEREPELESVRIEQDGGRELKSLQ